MEQTLGKRIIDNRKRLGLTQDRLAERLGVTAQAVSKWENDQSCPDITMLPKLAEIFGTSTDALLGIARLPAVHEVEIITEENEPNGLHIDNGTWELKYDGGRKSSIGIAVWVLLTGGLLLVSNMLHWSADLWDIAWPSGLLIFGFWGLYPKFSMLRLACGLFGGYNLLLNLNQIPHIGREFLLPVLLLLFGLGLLIDALKKNHKPHLQFSHNGKMLHDSNQKKFTTSCEIDGENFECAASFGEYHPLIRMPRLSRGEATVSFGEMTVDLTGCESLGDNCFIEANCSFGELVFLVPRRWRVESCANSAFAATEITGEHDPSPEGTIRMECNVTFGEIEIRYI